MLNVAGGIILVWLGFHLLIFILEKTGNLITRFCMLCAGVPKKRDKRHEADS